jgi:hypothetical protein
MKWYNVKEYDPLEQTIYVVRRKDGQIFIALAEYPIVAKDGPYMWINNAYCRECMDMDNEIKDVTHFCTIEPTGKLT